MYWFTVKKKVINKTPDILIIGLPQIQLTVVVINYSFTTGNNIDKYLQQQQWLIIIWPSSPSDLETSWTKVNYI